MMEGYHEYDYSEDPTVSICLNCTAETCTGSCARIRAIEAGKPDPGARYDGHDPRFTERGAAVRLFAEKHGISTHWVNQRLHDGWTLRGIEKDLTERAAKAAFIAEMEALGMKRPNIWKHLRKGRTWDEIREMALKKHVA